MTDRPALERLPAGTCDTHLHVYDHRYPVAPAAVLRPPDHPVADYRGLQHRLGVERVVVVQPTTYGLDNRCQLAALREFGDAARGVMVVDHRVGRDELARLTGAGVRGARFHQLPGGALGWDELEPVAANIAEFGWHVQLQTDGRDLAVHAERLRRLPVDVVIDHVGRFMPPGPLEHPGFEALLALLDTGRTWVKLSAPYESSPDTDAVLPYVDELVARRPDRLLWATNWPHPGQTARWDDHLLAWCERWLPTPELRRQVLVDNPALRYDF